MCHCCFDSVCQYYIFKLLVNHVICILLFWIFFSCCHCTVYCDHSLVICVMLSLVFVALLVLLFTFCWIGALSLMWFLLLFLWSILFSFCCCCCCFLHSVFFFFFFNHCFKPLPVCERASVWKSHIHIPTALPPTVKVGGGWNVAAANLWTASMRACVYEAKTWRSEFFV